MAFGIPGVDFWWSWEGFGALLRNYFCPHVTALACLSAVPTLWLHFKGPVALLETLLGCHVPSAVIYRLLFMWFYVLSSRNVSSDTVFQSIL